MPASLTQYRVTRSVDGQNYKFVVFGACAFCCRLTAEEYVDEAAFEAHKQGPEFQQTFAAGLIESFDVDFLYEQKL